MKAKKISRAMRDAINTLASTNVQRMPKQKQADYIIELSRSFKLTPNEFLQVMKPTIASIRAKSGKAYVDAYPDLMIFQSALFNARQAYRSMLAIRNGKVKAEKAKPVVKAKAKPAPVAKPAPAPAPVKAEGEDWSKAWHALGKAIFARA